MADANGNISTFLQEVDHVVGERKIDNHLRVLREEVGQDRHDAMRTERHVGIDPQPAAWLGCFGGEAAFDLIDVSQNRRCAHQVAFALGRQAERPGRALQQAYAKTALEPRNRAADGGGRKPERFRCCGEAAALGDQHESLHLADSSVHPGLPIRDLKSLI